MTQQRHAILGTIKHYQWWQLEPFLTTLAATTYQGAIIFFYDHTDAATLRFLRERGVHCVPFSETDAAYANYNFMCLRFFLYHLFLEKHPNVYDQIFLTDVRDVIFQGDPFSFTVRGVECFTECEDIPLSRPSANRRWVEESFGSEAIAHFGDKPVVCAGTILGTEPALREYLRVFNDTLLAQPQPRVVNDQGLHNYIIYTNRVPNVTIHGNTGPVLTLGLEDVVLSIDGTFRNAAGDTPLVVHQYDRHYALAKRYWGWRLRLLHHWDTWLDPRAAARGLRYRAAVYVRHAFPTLYAGIRRVFRGRPAAN